MIYPAKLKNNLKNGYTVASGQAIKARHPKGSNAMFSFSTDTFNDNRVSSLMYLYKNNAKVTIFSYLNNDAAEKLDFYNTGIVDFGMYIHLSLQADVIAENFTALDTEIGYNTTANAGNPPTTCAYGNGIDSFKDLLYSRFLGGRNSTHDNIGRSNGTGGSNLNINPYNLDDISKWDIISFPSINRPNYYSRLIPSINSFLSGTEEDSVNDYTYKVGRVLRNKGHYHAFSHWHWKTANIYDTYLAKIRELTDGQDVYFGTFEEFSKQWWLYDAIDSVSFDGTDTITINYTKKSSIAPYSNIDTKAWILFNKTGTPFEGSFIDTDITTEIIKKTDEVVAIGFDMNFASNSQNIVLNAIPNSAHYNREINPIINIDTGTGDVTSSQDITYTVFRKLKAENEWDVVATVFNSTPTKSFTLTLNTATYDYYLGWNNGFGKTGLIAI